MTRKLKKEKIKKNYEDKVKNAVEGIKPLGSPIPNRFLRFLIKNHVENPQD